MSASLIYSKIPKIMKAVGAVAKDRSNSSQGYKFRGIEDMYHAFHPVLVEAGVFCAPEVVDSQTSEIEGKNQSGAVKISYRVLLRVRHRFYAEDGSFVDVTTQGEGIDTSDKASNKAMSAAMKYAFIELFSIPTEDIEDSDRDSPEAGSLKPPAAPPVVTPNKSPSATVHPRTPTTAQIKRLFSIMTAHKIHEDALRHYVAEHFTTPAGKPIDSTKDLSMAQYDRLILDVQNNLVPKEFGQEPGANG